MNRFNKRKKEWFWFRVEILAVFILFSVVLGWFGSKLDDIIDNQQTIIEMQTSGMKTGLRIEDEVAQMRSELCQPWERRTKP
jgi:hypothetical protein